MPSFAAQLNKGAGLSNIPLSPRGSMGVAHNAAEAQTPPPRELFASNNDEAAAQNLVKALNRIVKHPKVKEIFAKILAIDNPNPDELFAFLGELSFKNGRLQAESVEKLTQFFQAYEAQNPAQCVNMKNLAAELTGVLRDVDQAKTLDRHIWTYYALGVLFLVGLVAINLAFTYVIYLQFSYAALMAIDFNTMVLGMAALCVDGLCLWGANETLENMQNELRKEGQDELANKNRTFYLAVPKNPLDKSVSEPYARLLNILTELVNEPGRKTPYKDKSAFLGALILLLERLKRPENDSVPPPPPTATIV